MPKLTLAVALIPCLMGAAHADDPSVLIGQQVMTTRWKIPVTFEGERIRELGLGEVYEVTQVKSGRLWVNEALGGWFSVNAVVPIDRALQYFDEKVISTGSAEDYRNRGIARLALGRLDAAINDFGEALQRNPSDPSIYNNRGNAWHSKRQFNKAIEDFDFAILLDAGFAHAYNNRGNAYRAMGNFEKAIDDYNAAIQIDPDYAFAFSNRGNAWNSKGNHEKAIADYGEAIRIDPKYAHAYNNRGSSWSAIGNLENAIADYNEAIRLNPKNAFAYNNLAWLLATSQEDSVRNGEEALKMATTAHELNNDDWGVLDTLAAASAESGQFSKAVEWITKAMDIAPASQLAYLGSRLADYRAERTYQMAHAALDTSTQQPDATLEVNSDESEITLD